jgi:hypothetical protein
LKVLEKEIEIEEKDERGRENVTPGMIEEVSEILRVLGWKFELVPFLLREQSLGGVRWLLGIEVVLWVGPKRDIEFEF